MDFSIRHIIWLIKRGMLHFDHLQQLWIITSYCYSKKILI